MPIAARSVLLNLALASAKKTLDSATRKRSGTKPAPSAPKLTATDGRRIFLMDAMSFIFRAYHAMARQRGMTTKTGLPTAATYVFVNMLRKLREDFSPEYLAAVFDVAAPTFRDTARRRPSPRCASST